jgi:hypothetical protein
MPRQFRPRHFALRSAIWFVATAAVCSFLGYWSTAAISVVFAAAIWALKHWTIDALADEVLSRRAHETGAPESSLPTSGAPDASDDGSKPGEPDDGT